MSGYILIVESDPVLQRRIGDTLKEARYELASEAEAAWARRSIAVRTPDAIVIDTVLSDGDGFALADELRREADTRQTPIFFIASRWRGASHRAEARRRFAPAEYLSVPIDVNSLLALMLEAIPPASDGTTNGTRDGTPAEIHAAPTDPIPSSRSQVTPLPRRETTEANTSRMTSQSRPEPSLRDPAQQRERRDVERTAKTWVASAAETKNEPTTELTGTLKKVPFARLMQKLYSRRASGSLLLLRNTTKKIVSFAEGYPVAVRSNVLAECLGQILLGQKLISSQALAESVRRMQREKRRQGEVLVEMGALSPYNLSRALVEQAEAKLFEIFSWRDGRFMFKPGEAAPKEAMRLARSPAALILEGIRRHYDSARQVAVLDHYARRYVALNADPVLRLQEVSAEPAELGFIGSIDGNDRLETILDRAEIARDKAGVLLVALSEAGMITPADAPTRPGPGPGPGQRPGEGAGAASRGQPPFLPPPRPAVQRHEARVAGAGHDADPADHDREDVSASRLLGDLDDDLELDLQLGALEARAGESEAIIEPGAAPRTIPALGAAASATPLSSGALSMVAQTVRTQDYFWALGVGRDATTQDIEHAYDALARTFHADGYRHSPDDDRKMAQEIFDRLSEAYRVLRDPAQRLTYAERLDRPDVESAEGRAHRADADNNGVSVSVSVGSGSGAPVPAAASAGNAAAQALYDTGLEHLKARRHHEAVEAFRQAARLVPGEADFRAALGWSLFREAPADARAGRAALAELRRAIQIDSRNQRALHYLASFYAETGQPDLAVDELEKILEIDPTAPNAVEAADQLRRLRQR